MNQEQKTQEKSSVKGLSDKFEGLGWIREGLFFGLFMFFFNTLLLPIILGEEYSLLKILVGIPLWILGGLSFGYAMKITMRFLVKNQKKIE